MKYLVVMRHGKYNRSSGNLTYFGIEQMKIIAMEIKAIVGEIYHGHYLLSSTALRAEQSAKIIADSFALETFDREEEIYSPVKCYSSKLDYFESIDKLIAPHIEENDLVTIVSHHYVVNNYSKHVLNTLFREHDENINNSEVGEGIIFNIKAKTYQMLPKK